MCAGWTRSARWHTRWNNFVIIGSSIATRISRVIDRSIAIIVQTIRTGKGTTRTRSISRLIWTTRQAANGGGSIALLSRFGHGPITIYRPARAVIGHPVTAIAQKIDQRLGATRTARSGRISWTWRRCGTASIRRINSAIIIIINTIRTLARQTAFPTTTTGR